MVWEFSQSQASSCCRWQKTQPILSVSCIPKETATSPETCGPLGNAFESLRRKILIHPTQAPGSNLVVILWGETQSHSSLTHRVPQQLSMSPDKTNKQRSSFPRIHLSEAAFPRISDVDRLFPKPSSCLFCHSDQTQWVGMLKLHQKREFKWVCILVWCCHEQKRTKMFRA